jgi:hypothetical protein
MDSKQFDELVARLASAATRRDAVKGIAGGALASVGVTSVASAQKKSKGKATAQNHKKSHCTKKQKRQKVTICHKGQEITVSKCAWQKGHRKHGDTKKVYGVPCPPA